MTGGSGVIIRRPSVPESLRILLGEADCDGALGVVEMALSPGVSGPPLHLHPTHAEAFYVLAGQLSLQVGEEVVTGGPGTWACAPKDVPHTLGNFGTDEGRLLCMFAPGGFERRFERMLAKQHGLNFRRPSGQRELSGHRSSPGLSLPDQLRPSSAVVPHDAGRCRTRRRTGRTRRPSAPRSHPTAPCLVAGPADSAGGRNTGLAVIVPRWLKLVCMAFPELRRQGFGFVVRVLPRRLMVGCRWSASRSFLLAAARLRGSIWTPPARHPGWPL